MAALIAAMPEAKASPAIQPSIAATRFSNNTQAFLLKN